MAYIIYRWYGIEVDQKQGPINRAAQPLISVLGQSVCVVAVSVPAVGGVASCALCVSSSHGCCWCQWFFCLFSRVKMWLTGCSKAGTVSLAGLCILHTHFVRFAWIYSGIFCIELWQSVKIMRGRAADWQSEGNAGAPQTKTIYIYMCATAKNTL